MIENLKKRETKGDAESGRREFLNRASCAVLSAIVASGISAESAVKLPVAAVLAESEGGAERSYPVPDGDGVSIDRDNEVILIRSGNRIYAFALACPHENTALRWQAQEKRFQCPRHKSIYQPDGAYLSGRSTRNMDRYALRLENGRVLVDLSRLYRIDQQKEEWDAAVLVL